MKIVVTHCAKRGLPEFSSISFGASLEIELREGTPEEVAASFKAAARDLRALVKAELDRQQVPSPNGNGSHGKGYEANGRHPSNGNGSNNAARGPRNGGSAGDELISAKQIKFANGLRRRARLSARDLDERAREIAGDPSVTLRDLTMKQASVLIEDLLAESEAAA